MDEEKSFWRRILAVVGNHKLVSFLILVALVGSGYYWYQKRSAANSSPTTYKTEAVKRGDISVMVTGSGQAESVTQVDLKPVVAGDSIEVMNVYVKNDQEVKKDQMIALLDAKDAEKSVRNAELSLKSAKVKYASVKRQYDRNQISKYDKESQQLAVEQAQNSLDDARDNLKDYYIRAPFDGIITNLSVESGDSISRSDILASIITKDSHAAITLNEVDAAKVKESDAAKITFDALPGVEISGKVSKINTIGTVSQGVVSYGAEISFDSQNEMIKPGMSVSAEIAVEAKSNVLMVPSSAIKNQNGESYVLVMANASQRRTTAETSNLANVSAPERKKVETGISNDVYTEIVSGLSEGENVVTETLSATNSSSVNLSNSANSSSSNRSSGLRIPGLGGGGRN